MITVGIDEVGRGCWAGPLVASAVALPDDHLIVGLKDSKKLTKLQREKLSAHIQDQALAFGIGWVSSSELDKVGLSSAVKLAMERAMKAIAVDYDQAIIDGNINYFQDNPKAKAVVKADNTVPAVSAASIIAKVARDAYMQEQNALYPQYGFDKHVGYGTAMHVERLLAHGVCELHRMTFKPVRTVLTSSK